MRYLSNRNSAQSGRTRFALRHGLLCLYCYVPRAALYARVRLSVLVGSLVTPAY